ncbi:CBS domain containing protein [Pyrodictium delaneyi]|uniref:CBS domain containing protein n=1 Tax=Pyrodictium delaneyi TaxID=1273541 RepID=A0A0P0N2F7_9CREN|nr:CBS domain-containing protein [Pyrodictium delaneyi]ALL00458.1 CBS domain containing protein [Pyrodictium delaneyi]OWJ53931.1 hypothetical protein Pdsh_08575 [Pyrodictium delaneyi]
MTGQILPLVKDVMEAKRLSIAAADLTLRKAAEVMLANRATATVTLDAEKRPSLVLSLRRLVKAVAEGTDLDKARVAEYAVTDPVVVRLDDPIDEALRIMKKEMVRFLPVVDHRNRIRGHVEPRHIAFHLWRLIPYGTATVEAKSRNMVVIDPDASLQAAAKAMDSNGVTEVFVRSGDELKILREWDFLAALVEGVNPAEARVGDYARGEAIRVPADFDARAAVELMEENDVLRLVVHDKEANADRVVTATDLAFAALSHIEKVGLRTVALILINVEPGREQDVAAKLAEIDEVKEVLSVPGIYDLVARVEASDVDTVAEIVTRRIRGMREIRDTLTLVAIPYFRKARA